MKRLFSSTRAFSQVLCLLTVFGFLGLGEVSAQWLNHQNGVYYNGHVGINKTPSSWIDLDIRNTMRLVPDKVNSTGWGSQFLFGDYYGQPRFFIVDDFGENCLSFHNSVNKGYFQFEGKVSISGAGGTSHYLPTGANSDWALSVPGKIVTHEVVVTTNGWADYVFQPSYDLLPLETVATHIEENGFLPNMPCASEVEENGIEVSTMTVKQQEKIEELFLHMIDMNERLKSLETENAALQAEIKRLR